MHVGSLCQLDCDFEKVSMVVSANCAAFSCHGIERGLINQLKTTQGPRASCTRSPWLLARRLLPSRYLEKLFMSSENLQRYDDKWHRFRSVHQVILCSVKSHTFVALRDTRSGGVPQSHDEISSSSRCQPQFLEPYWMNTREPGLSKQK